MMVIIGLLLLYIALQGLTVQVLERLYNLDLGWPKVVVALTGPLPLVCVPVSAYVLRRRDHEQR